MAKPAQVLDIDPPTELLFSGPFTEVTTSYLKLTNPSDQQICFKVKTTAPKQYCVRPNSGFIPPKGHVTVAVMLQPLDINNPEERGKHKFMVQSSFVPAGETSLDNMWKNTPANMLMDTKLKVTFDMPEASSMETAPSQPQRPAATNASTTSSGGTQAETENRRLVDETKRLQAQLQASVQESRQLMEKISRLEKQQYSGTRAQGGQAVTPVSSVTYIHVVAVAIIALIVGLIGGMVI